MEACETLGFITAQQNAQPALCEWKNITFGMFNTDGYRFRH